MSVMRATLLFAVAALALVSVKGEANNHDIPPPKLAAPHAAAPKGNVQERVGEGEANNHDIPPPKLAAPHAAAPKGNVQERVGEGRRLKGGVLRKLALPLLVLMKLKAGVALPALFGAVALVAFKGMWSGMTALAVTAAIALRGLIPPPKIIQLPAPHAHHAVVSDYYTDYRRNDDLSRMDDYRYGW